MNQDPSESPSAPLPPPTQPRPVSGNPSASAPVVRSAGQWMLLLALVVALSALALSGMLWQKLDFTQQELARRSLDSGKMAVEAKTIASQAEALTQELQARLSVAEVRLSEVSLQRSQLDELMLTLSRSRDDNLVQDLEATLRLAQQQTQLTGSAQPLISALQAIDQRIGRAAQPRLNPVQRAIARDIERIQAASLADIPALVLRLDEVARQVDEWPLLNQVGHRPVVTPVPVAPSPDPDAVSQPPETDPASGLGDGWARAAGWWSGLWSMIWTDVTRSGRELVRVSRIDEPEAVLLAPEQAFFIRENLKLKLLNARLGMLARHMVSSQADLIAVEAAIGKYFDTASPLVRGARVAIGQVRQDIVDGVLPRPEETLAALNAAAEGR
ncbi:uroporphyrinogen-III C-methyltransferase [Hydrogenophaga sp.]|uniref:uroporphyrinogen-III C-methyltransferase n=1 Tax=Hydrogenophaga sp. TaxID=1904254 RepID=UPI002726DF88|nr:uroporphyrinogen-III C-methyltransferase [Hydrogenophaga sp.]MDO8906451.1 uroporphyrinogen-III C-methyltransferase [Hydrogenophaga sp.]